MSRTIRSPFKDTKRLGNFRMSARRLKLMERRALRKKRNCEAMKEVNG